MALRLTCKQASRLISEEMERRLSFAERVALRLHVRICDACARFTRQMQFLRRALQRFPGPDENERL